MSENLCKLIFGGDLKNKLFITSVEILDDEPLLAFYPDSIAGFRILSFLAAGEEPRLVPEGLPVSVNAVTGAITITPKLAYLDGKTPVDVGNILVRNEPFETQKEYILAVEIQGIDSGTPAENLKCTVKNDPANPKLLVVKEQNGTEVEVSEPPLKIKPGGFSEFVDRSTVTEPEKFFSGALSIRNSNQEVPYDSSTPNGELIPFEDLIINPHHLEEVTVAGTPPAVTSIDKLVPPGFNVLDKHIEIHLELEFESSGSTPVAFQPLLKLRVQNEENFEEYPRAFYQVQIDPNLGLPDIILNNSNLDNTDLKTFAADFAEELEKQFAGSEPDDSMLLTWGASLWTNARDFVQTNLNPGSGFTDDRILYHIRLQCLVALKAYYKRHNLPDLLDSKKDLFELPSRGLDVTSSDVKIETFSNEKKIIVTGFDPFFLAQDPSDSNSSGLGAISLDNRTFSPTGSEEYYVRSAIFPVRYKELDEGLIEQVVENSIGPIAMLATTSWQSKLRDQNFQEFEVFSLERFTTSFRVTNTPDNLNIRLSNSDAGLGGPYFWKRPFLIPRKLQAIKIPKRWRPLHPPQRRDNLF